MGSVGSVPRRANQTLVKLLDWSYEQSVQYGSQEMSEQITDVYEVVGRVTATLLEDHDPLALAAVLMVMGMRIYKTVLDPEEYSQIVDDVVSRKDRVHPIDTMGPIQ